MYVYVNDKLYINDESKNKYIGVEIHPDGLMPTGEEFSEYTDGLILTSYEVMCKFGITNLKVIPKKIEGEKVERITKTKKSAHSK